MTDARRERSSFAVGLAAVALLALVIRLLFALAVDPEVPAIGDASAYHLLARNLADGDGYIRPFDDALLAQTRATAEYPPLFPAALAVVDVLGGDSVEAQRAVFSFVGAGTVVLVGLLGRRVGGPTVGIVAALLAACYPMLFLSEGILMAEALSAPLTVLVLLLAYHVVDRPTPAGAALLGAGLGILTLTRAEGLLLSVILAGALLWRIRSVDLRRRLVLAAATALAVTLAVVTPWTVRNALRLDAFVPVSTNVATLLDGANCDPVYGGSQLGLWRETFSTLGDAARERPQEEACFEGFAIADPDFEEAGVAGEHRREGIRYTLDHLGSQPKVMAVRWLRTWGLYAARQQVDFESLEGRPRGWQMAGTVVYWGLLPLALAGVVILLRRHVPVWPLHATALSVSIVAALTYGQQRFRVGAEPALLVTAAVALVALVHRLR